MWVRLVFGVQICHSLFVGGNRVSFQAWALLCLIFQRVLIGVHQLRVSNKLLLFAPADIRLCHGGTFGICALGIVIICGLFYNHGTFVSLGHKGLCVRVEGDVFEKSIDLLVVLFV